MTSLSEKAPALPDENSEGRMRRDYPRDPMKSLSRNTVSRIVTAQTKSPEYRTKAEWALVELVEYHKEKVRSNEAKIAALRIRART